MIVLIGFIYVVYFLLLGAGARFAFNMITNNQLVIAQKTEFIAHAFFQGVFLHIIFFNTLQLLNLSVSGLLTGVGLLILSSIATIFWQLRRGLTIETNPNNHKQAVVISLLIIIGSMFIYWNAYSLPNIAWDSWAVWEGRAQQWVNHGLGAEILRWDEWLQNDRALFNQAANYPDGLSLIYFLPKLLFNQGFAATQVVYLFAFALMTVLLVRRVAKNGTSIYLQAFMVLVIYTTPMISTHLMIQGYADIWLAMYVLLVMLTLMDYKETGYSGLGMSLLCYVAVLPMLKLEGWIWLILFFVAYLLVWLWQNKHRSWIFGAAVFLVLIFISGIINFSSSWGDLVINRHNITVFNLLNTPIEFINITDQLLASFFWQNNWSLIWLGLPFLMVSFFTQKHDQAHLVAQVFLITALLCFLFLFYFTEASKWALDLTAINRLILQLTPCYLFLLFRMLAHFEHFKPKK